METVLLGLFVIALGIAVSAVALVQKRVWTRRVQDEPWIDDLPQAAREIWPVDYVDRSIGSPLSVSGALSNKLGVGIALCIAGVMLVVVGIVRA